MYLSEDDGKQYVIVCAPNRTHAFVSYKKNELGRFFVLRILAPLATIFVASLSSERPHFCQFLCTFCSPPVPSASPLNYDCLFVLCYAIIITIIIVIVRVFGLHTHTLVCAHCYHCMRTRLSTRDGRIVGGCGGLRLYATSSAICTSRPTDRLGDDGGRNEKTLRVNNVHATLFVNTTGAQKQ